MNTQLIRRAARFVLLFSMGFDAAPAYRAQGVHDARIAGRQILNPAPPPAPRITGAALFGVVSATGEKPIKFSATGLPAGVRIDPASGWIAGRAPRKAGDVLVTLAVRKAKGSSRRKLTLRVGETIALTPPMGWNSWYVHSEGVSERAVRETAAAMQEKGLADHGWTYLNIDDCWMTAKASGKSGPKTWPTAARPSPCSTSPARTRC